MRRLPSLPAGQTMALPIIRQTLVLFFLLFCQAACTSTDETVPDNNIQCETDSVTYSGTIVPILKNNCYTCHDKNNATAFAEGITLEGYENLKKQVDKERLIGAIRHKPGFSAMPRSLPQLPECTIQEIEKWIETGAPNN